MVDVTLTEYVILAAVSAVSGLIGGMSGLALGTMRLPVMLFIGIDPFVAAGTNLGVGLFGSLAGSWEHVRSGRVMFRIVFLMGLPGVTGAFIGGVFADTVPAWLLLICVSALIFWSAFNLIVNAVSSDGAAGAESGTSEDVQGKRRYFRLARDSTIGLMIGAAWRRRRPASGDVANAGADESYETFSGASGRHKYGNRSSHRPFRLRWSPDQRQHLLAFAGRYGWSGIRLLFPWRPIHGSNFSYAFAVDDRRHIAGAGPDNIGPGDIGDARLTHAAAHIANWQ